MNNANFQKLVNKAGEMALHNVWGENAYKINMAILRLDQNNSAACTRLAKYYRLCGNMAEAKNMYIKALEIDPGNRGAMNNLEDIEREEQETDRVDRMNSCVELFKAGQSSMLKGKYNLASKFFSKAYGKEPLLKYAVSLAGVYKKMGKAECVEKLYRELIEASRSKLDIDAVNTEFAALIKDRIHQA